MRNPAEVATTQSSHADRTMFALFVLLTILFSGLLLAGCGTVPSNALPGAASDIGVIEGTVHGGRQPIVASHVFLYAAGTGGNAGPGIAPSAANASTSLLNAVGSAQFPTTFDPVLQAYFVTTDVNGSFNLSGSYTCVPGTQVYIYALGGKPDGAVVNTSAGLIAALATCPAEATLANIVHNVIVNEVSTVAASFALAGYATDATHISSANTTLARTGIANALATAANMYDISGGHGVLALTTPPTSPGTVPQTEIHALANGLAACINSGGSSSSQCSALFSNVKSNGATGTTATDTVGVAINIAHNPGNAVSTIFNNPTGIGAPFQPTLSTAPHDFSIELSYYSGTLGFPEFVAIDDAGNVFVSCYDGTISKYSPTGVLNPGGYFSGGGLNHTIYLAIDASGNVWAANQGGHTVSKFSTNGVAASSTGFKGNNDLDPAGIAIDPSGNIWVANYGNNSVSKLDSAGNEFAGSPYTPMGLNAPWQLAVDPSGNVWVGNYNAANIVELTNTGAAAGMSPFYTGGYATPRSVVIGAAGTPWVANFTGASITHVTTAGVGTNVSGGLSSPSDISIDGSGNVWVASKASNAVVEFSSTGMPLSPAGYTGAEFNQPYGLAVDGSGNVWIANGNGDNLLEMVGIATPAITPVVTATSTNAIGSRP